ncbi:MAG: tripartite tricarboxylate transporter TctB family protein [Desulfobacterales bacterium]|nr:tripartite tricarboxylate transporter TctB family protein [Desulfobacterales bacterium]
MVYPIMLGHHHAPFSASALVLMELAGKAPPDVEGQAPKSPASSTRHGREIAPCDSSASLGYALIFEPLGYVDLHLPLSRATVLFLVNGQGKLARDALVAVLFSVGVYVLFSVVLGDQAPAAAIPRHLRRRTT